ncbi:SRPBCC family protein [uncultured Roseobacter sp.]|uniref:SRPBCC family protein n=1 Tax=uncultured Roseobacter sp. TaxID=114847 RepID=UPI00262DAC0B|nr:SRPBCC family protein [uncultured Roseobacter sp.]
MVRVLRSTILPAPLEAVWEILRDFNGHDQWHPAIATSQIERGQPADRVGCVRKFRLEDGAELREQLLTLSDADAAYSYCLLDTPVPLFNYVSHVRLIPVTDADHTYWQWDGQFDTRPEERDEMTELVGSGIYQAGFDAIRAQMGLEA